MNLNSLLDESLVDIFKYADYPTMFGIRKLDSRMNRIAKRYDVGTEVDVLEVNMFIRDLYSRIEVELSDNMRKFCKNLNNNKRREPVLVIAEFDEFTKIPEMFSRFKIHDELSIHVYRQPKMITEDMLERLCEQKYSISRLRLFSVYETNYTICTKSSLQKFVKNSKQLRCFIFIGPFSNYNIFHAEVFEGRHWNRFSVEYSVNVAQDRHWFLPLVEDALLPLTGMNEQFFNNVIRNCDEFIFLPAKKFVANFTVLDVIDLLEKTVNCDFVNEKREWQLPLLSLGKLTAGETVALIRQFKESRIQPEWEFTRGQFFCEIRIPLRNTKIQFYLEATRAEIRELYPR